MPNTRQLRGRNIVEVPDVHECQNCINSLAVLNYSEFTGLYEDVLFCASRYYLYPFTKRWSDGCEYYQEVPDR